MSTCSPCWRRSRRLRQIGLDGVVITERRHRMWLLSLLWAEKGKGRRHLGLTWNRGQLMIQFREVFFFPYRFAWASCCSVSGRFQQTPLTSRPLPIAPCSGLSSRGMLGSAVAHFSCVACVLCMVCAHSSVPPVLCIASMIMQRTVRAIWGTHLSHKMDKPAYRVEKLQNNRLTMDGQRRCRSRVRVVQDVPALQRVSSGTPR